MLIVSTFLHAARTSLTRMANSGVRRRSTGRFSGRQLGPALFAMGIGGFAIGTTEFGTMGILPQIAEGTHVSIAQAGDLVSAYALGVMVGAPVFAAVAARLPRRSVLVGLMGLFVLAHLASAAAPNFDTLLVFRFISGLPHGAYFGIAAVVAAALAPPGRASRAVSMVMVGLTAANIAGVPVGTWLGQALGWQALFVVVALIAAACLVAILAVVPHVEVPGQSSMASELTALRRPQVWMAMLLGVVGFGGMFTIYAYITPSLTHLSGIGDAAVPPILATYGVGMTLGTILGGRLADRSRNKTIGLGLIAMAAVFISFAPLASIGLAGGFAAAFLLGLTGSILLPALQVKLMEAAPDGRSLAAALNHSTLNAANAIGAWLGGAVLSSGLGWAWPSRVATVLPLLGLVVLSLSIWMGRRALVAARTPAAARAVSER